MFTKVEVMRLTAVLGLLGWLGTGQAAPVLSQGSWATTLQARDLDGEPANGPEAFYDSVFNITWLRAGSSSRMSWVDANAWAATQVRYGFSGWRLPTLVDVAGEGCAAGWTYSGTDCGYHVDTTQATGSEMGHLFFDLLGNTGRFSPAGAEQAGYGLTNSGDFQIQQSWTFWSGVEVAVVSPPADYAFYFNTEVGSQFDAPQDNVFYALAVRDGDVFPGNSLVSGQVAEPQSLALALVALAGLGRSAVLRRRRSSQL